MYAHHKPQLGSWCSTLTSEGSGLAHREYRCLQKRIRKFFGKPNGAKPAPAQQSKLSFSTKPKPAPKAEEVDDEPEVAKENQTSDTETKHSPNGQ